MYSGAVPVVNPLARELVFKVVYYGPGLGGKTTTLQHIHATTKPEHRGRMVSLATPVDRTLYFDFLPIRIPHVRDMGVRLQLFTVPGQVYYNATRKLVLTGADGVVFVADSQRARMDANLESWENLRENLREHGRILGQLPHVLQLNKRDLPEVMETATLEKALNAHHVPCFATVAIAGTGVYEALEAITRAVLAEFETRMPGEHAPVDHGLQIPEGGLAEALRKADHPAAPDPTPTAPAATGPREPLPSPSGLFQLSLIQELDVGENAARALTEGVISQPTPPPAESADPAAPKLPLPPPIPSRAGAQPISPAPSETDDSDAEPPSSGGNRPIALSRPRSHPPEPPAASTGVSFTELWPSSERVLALEVETSLGTQDYARAVVACEKLVSRVLATVASVLGSTADAPRDPSVVALLLGLQGARVLEFRALVREARAGRGVLQKAALSAYAFALELNLARSRAIG